MKGVPIASVLLMFLVICVGCSVRPVVENGTNELVTLRSTVEIERLKKCAEMLESIKEGREGLGEMAVVHQYCATVAILARELLHSLKLGRGTESEDFIRKLLMLSESFGAYGLERSREKYRSITD